jgi:hypothetical protein
MGIEPRLGEPNEANEGSRLNDFDRPQTPSPLGEDGLSALCEEVALYPSQRGRKELHDLRVCVEIGEGI